MNHFRILSQVLNGIWAIDQSEGLRVLPYVLHRLGVWGDQRAVDTTPREKSNPSIQADLHGDESKIGLVNKTYSDPTADEEAAGGVGYWFGTGVVGKYFGMSEDGLNLGELQNALLQFEASELQALVIHLDSPGGSPFGVEQIVYEINRIQMETGKKILGYSDTMMCSAAQWMLSSCHRIFIDRHAMAGSKGCYTVHEDARKFYEEKGRKFELISDGEYKGMGLSMFELTEKHRAKIKADVVKYSKDFGDTLQHYRGEISEDNMQGQSFIGMEAVEAGFADGVADTISDVFNYARKC